MEGKARSGKGPAAQKGQAGKADVALWQEPAGKKAYTDAQREIAEKIREILIGNLDRHVTIAEVSQMVHVSPTQAKVCFRKVYGIPVFSYARARRMAAAARLLADTDESILEIAGRFGYENGSKFANAFRSERGESPAEYRRRIRWEREEGRAGQ